MTDKQKYVCALTGVELESTRIPRGWKNINGQTLSPKGWKTLFETVALRVPISWPQNKDEQKEFITLIRAGQNQAREVANWLMSRWFALDCAETAFEMVDGKPKLAKWKRVPDMYRQCKERFSLEYYPSDLLAGLIHRLEPMYQQCRWEVHIGRQSLPSFRSMPVVIRGQSATWRLEESERGTKFPVLTTSIARQRLTMALCQSAGGSETGRRRFNRQFDTLVNAIESGWILGEVQVTTDINGQPFVVVIATLPKRPKQEQTGTLFVRSDDKSMIVALNEKEDKLWTYNADHVTALISEHRRRLTRFSEDSKFEDRPRPSFQMKRDRMSNRYNRRMKTLTQQIAARIVGYAERRKFRCIQVDFQNTKFCPEYRWAELVLMITRAASRDHIQVIDASKLPQLTDKQQLLPS